LRGRGSGEGQEGLTTLVREPPLLPEGKRERKKWVSVWENVKNWSATGNREKGSLKNKKV